MRILIRQAQVVNPAGESGRMDVLVDAGRVQAMGLDLAVEGARIVDARGHVLSPGLIDVHVHLREPGQTHKETIETGCLAASRGGFTAVCAMPNTRPANDCPEVTREILDKAARSNGVRVLPVAAITRGLGGTELSPFEALRDAGAVAVSDDGMPVMNSRIMREAIEAAGRLGLRVISHSEDLSLAEGGVMNEGETARRLKVRGIPNAAESIGVMREIALSELTGVPVHIAHVSTAQSVTAIRDAKARGIPVTAETAPHYLTLTDAEVETRGTHAKMNPPLRSAADRQAVREGLADGTLDMIATDHAPHAPSEKALGLADAPNGVIGLESALPVSLSLVADGTISLPTLIERMAVNPARLLGLPDRIAVGSPADLTLIDIRTEYTLSVSDFLSKSRNCPFDGWRVRGRALLTMTAGRILYELPGGWE